VRSHTYDIRLTSAEAVVLFELLHRMREEDGLALDLAEHAVTESLLQLLEGALTERVELGYASMVERAKRQAATAR
jgi:hypothetical protein